MLAIYIHWPFCASKCPYCDFNSHVREAVDVDAWQAALLAELDHMAGWMPNETVSSIFFGGGTPSLMPPEIAGALIERVTRIYKCTDNIEITLEANPNTAEASRFRDFRSAGINRLSLGVQSLREDSLKFLGRTHGVQEATGAIELAAQHFDRYSFDLIYARPGQTLTEWEAELDEALGYADGHLSLYQLTIEPNTAFHHAYHQRKSFVMPPDDDAAELYEWTLSRMASAGLPAYEISNHAKPGQESRHNLSYWQGDAYLGVGPGAHGRICANGQWYATHTVKSPERWLQQVVRHGHALEEKLELTSAMRAEERVMTGLRLKDGLRWDATLSVINRDAAQQLNTLGLIEYDDTRLRATPKGWPVLNRLIAELLQDT